MCVCTIPHKSNTIVIPHSIRNIPIWRINEKFDKLLIFLVLIFVEGLEIMGDFLSTEEIARFSIII